MSLDFVVAETQPAGHAPDAKTPDHLDVEHMSEGQMLNVTLAVFWRSYAGVPIAAKGQVIGFINLGSLISTSSPRSMPTGCRSFAEQAAIAIQNARLHEETRWPPTTSASGWRSA